MALHRGPKGKDETDKAEEVAELMRVAALLLAQSEHYSRRARAVLARKEQPDDADKLVGRPKGRPRKIVETEKGEA